MIFLGREFLPSHNKTALFDKPTNTKFLKLCSDEDLKKKYRTWLMECHEKYDQEVFSLFHENST